MSTNSVPVTQRDTNQLDPSKYPGDAAIIQEHPELAPISPEVKQSTEALRKEIQERINAGGSRDAKGQMESLNADPADVIGARLTEAVGNLQDVFAKLQKEQNIATERAVLLGRLRAENAAAEALAHDAKRDLFDMKHLDQDTIEVSLRTGEIFRGSPLEVVNKLAESQVNTKQWAQEVARAAGYEKPGQLLRDHRDNPIEQPTNAPDMSQPIDASGITPDHIAKALGFSNGAELLQFGNGLVEMQQQLRLSEAASTFYAACPDYPGTPEADNALAQVMESVGLPETPQGLAAAHALAVRAGYYQPLPKEALEPQSQPRTRPAPPPVVTSGGQATANPVDEYSMPLNELRRKLLSTPFGGNS